MNWSGPEGCQSWTYIFYKRLKKTANASSKMAGVLAETVTSHKRQKFQAKAVGFLNLIVRKLPESL